MTKIPAYPLLPTNVALPSYHRCRSLATSHWLCGWYCVTLCYFRMGLRLRATNINREEAAYQRTPLHSSRRIGDTPRTSSIKGGSSCSKQQRHSTLPPSISA